VWRQCGAFDRAKVILEGMGSAEKLFHAGPAGAGQVAKAANNMLLAVHMIGTSEALAMGEAHGLDPAVLSEIMKASSGNNWSLQVYNPWPDVMEGVPSSNDYQPGFMVDLMVKDLGLACEVAESCGLNNQMGKQAMATSILTTTGTAACASMCRLSPSPPCGFFAGQRRSIWQPGRRGYLTHGGGIVLSTGALISAFIW
jgi:3-hydroxyisobutyrate dehydrogenase-like beta-hydroxyacid dehydrogenase